MNIVKQIGALLDQCSDSERREIFRRLRREFSIHPLEEKYNVRAEIILEAIDRTDDITQRGIKGIITELFFKIEVIDKLEYWSDITPPGTHAFDFKIEDRVGPVRVQVKMQRREAGVPMTSMGKKKLRRSFRTEGLFVVETQKTRGGTDSSGANTRPYRFGEFDILAVSMQPSTNDWSKFMYTVADWLVPHPDNAALLRVLQPVAPASNNDWTDDFLTVVTWLRSGVKKTISL